jgi:hypothetical protein
MNKFCGLTFAIFAYVFVSAQYLNDAQVWGSIYLDKKVSKHFDIHLKHQSRFTSNISQYTRGYADLGVTYRINKNIRVLADAVFGEKKKYNDNYSQRYTYYVAVILKKDIGRFRFSYRNMVQAKHNDLETSKYGYLFRYKERNKVTIRYEASKRFLFYTAHEVNLPLNNQNSRNFDRYRAYLGMLYNVTKHQQLELYFMVQTQLQKDNWYKQDDSYPNTPLNRYYVYGVGYNIEF